jgi:hypothetical protein
LGAIIHRKGYRLSWDNGKGKILFESGGTGGSNKAHSTIFRLHKNKRPFFYDVVKGIVQGILEDDDNDSWADKIIFSNLIKIGKETAPDLYEYPAQNDYAKLLFLLELKEIKPDVVLLITSLDFGEDFSSALGLETLDSIKKSDFVIVKGEYKGAKVILTRCPDVGDADECVMQVLDHLSSPITSKFS